MRLSIEVESDKEMAEALIVAYNNREPLEILGRKFLVVDWSTWTNQAMDGFDCKLKQIWEG